MTLKKDASIYILVPTYRQDIFLTTKLWPSDYGFQKALDAFEGSKRRLGVEYLDLYLLHWPDCHGSVTDKKSCLADTWKALELLLEQGKCRAIGVSNFMRHHLEGILETARIVPHVNQCEFHPYQNPKDLREFCAQKKIHFQVGGVRSGKTLMNEVYVKEVR